MSFILIINVGLPVSYADTEPEIACAEAKKLLDKAYEMEGWKEAELKDQDAYEEAFEEMQMAYHDYVGCMFDFAESEILQKKRKEKKGKINWMIPEQACLDTTDLKDIIKRTDPSQMLGPILDARAKYTEHLLILGAEFDAGGIVIGEKGKKLKGLEALSAKRAHFDTLIRQRRTEIDSSLLAIDLMFTSLKELRLSFVMHVHFQCTLKFLEKYRRALEDLRDVIEPLPDQLEDASVS